MELKLTILVIKPYEIVKFQSYLYGIEMSPQPLATTLRPSFNRTFMELKFAYDGTQKTDQLRFNRTFMELKCGYYHGQGRLF